MKRGDRLLEIALAMLRIGEASAWARWLVDARKTAKYCRFTRYGHWLGVDNRIFARHLKIRIVSTAASSCLTF